MRLLLCVWFLLVITGCAIYKNSKVEVTKTEYPDGRVVTETKKCDTSLNSAREVKSGDLQIGDGCTVKGSAEQLNFNDNLYGIAGSMAKGFAEGLK